MRSVCAWCEAILDGQGPLLPGEDASHGMCQDCYKKTMASIKKCSWCGKMLMPEDESDDMCEKCRSQSLDQMGTTDLDEIKWCTGCEAEV
jgi:NMD protein affecting ribosome stability and mRNA decay